MGEAKRRKQLDPNWGKVQKKVRKVANGFVALYDIEREFRLVVQNYPDSILIANDSTQRGATICEYLPAQMKFTFFSKAALINNPVNDTFCFDLLESVAVYNPIEEIVIDYISGDDESCTGIAKKLDLEMQNVRLIDRIWSAQQQ